MARQSPPGTAVSPSDAASSIPRSYRLAETLICLGLRHRQHLYKSGFYKQIRRYRVGARAFVYNAEDVEEWARRLARRRILMRHRVITRSRKFSRLVEAPATNANDVACPVCGAFALRYADRILCERHHGHRMGGE